MTARRSPGVRAALLACALLLPCVASAPSPASAATVPVVGEVPAGVRQLVVVTAASWTSTTATVRAWQRDSAGRWHQSGATVHARLGRNGLAAGASRRQSTGTTPTGRFAVLSAFGIARDPGTRLAYRQVQPANWWVYDPRDPATYNTFVARRAPDATWRTSWAEHLSAYGAQYRYALVLDFNIPHPGHPADVRRGGGIFMHALGPELTAGCIAVPQDQLVRLLRWMDPAQQPTVVVQVPSAGRTTSAA